SGHLQGQAIRGPPTSRHPAARRVKPRPRRGGALMAVTAPLAVDLAMGLDPVALVTRAGMTPDPWQARVLRSTSRRLLLNASRQSGKITTTAGEAVHTALYAPGSLSLLLSPSLRQSGELFRK